MNLPVKHVNSWFSCTVL